MKPVKSTDLSVGANRLLAMQSSIKNKDIGVGLRSHPDKTAQAMQLPVRFCIIPELPKGRSHLSVTGGLGEGRAEASPPFAPLSRNHTR